jgi:hypothetical protein
MKGRIRMALGNTVGALALFAILWGLLALAG